MLNVKNTENEKQEEAHNSPKDNPNPSFCLGFGSCLQKILKHLSSYKNLWHFAFISFFCFVYFLFHFFDYLFFLKDSQNFFNHSLILTSYDSYFYALGAKEFLESLKTNIPYLSILAGILAKAFGLDWVLVWSSVFLSVSFGIILYFLVFLLLQNFGILTQKTNQIFAFLGAFLGLFAPHFYQRTGVGYFDTDMLILSLPLLALLGLWLYIVKQRFYWLAFFALFGFLSVNWHNGIQNLLLAGFLLYLAFEALCWLRFKNFKTPILEISSVFLIILTPSKFCILFLVLVLLAIKTRKIMLFVFLLACLYAGYFGLFNPLIAQIKAYLFGEIQYSSAYVYASVVDGILETSPCSLEVLVQRSGGWIVFCGGIIGFLGFGLYAFRKQSFYIWIFLFPFLLLGLASLKMGVRFSFFLSPILALGLVVGVVLLLGLVRKFLVSGILVFAVFLSFFMETLEYHIPKPILTKSEVESLKALNLTQEDIVFSWWDYGYAIKYLTNAKTLLDGGLHSGSANYPIAEILSSPSALMAKNLSFILAQKMEELQKKEWNLLFEVILKENSQAPREFLESLQNPNFKIQNYPKGEVFWVLPKRILPLAANIYSFRNLDIKEGKKLVKDVFVYNGGLLKTTEEYLVYQNFYVKKEQSGIPLAMVFWEGNRILMDFDYFKSNLIQWVIFKNNPAMELVLDNDSLVVYQVRK